MTDDTISVELTEDRAKDIIDMMEFLSRKDDISWDGTADAVADILGQCLDSDDPPEMGFDTYQDQTEETAVYPDAYLVGRDTDVPDSAPPRDVDVDTGILYTALGLNGEAGEVAEKIKKDLRGDKPDEPVDLGDELGDVLWYLARLCDELEYSFDAVARRNVRKLTDRAERDVIRGSGDER